MKTNKERLRLAQYTVLQKLFDKDSSIALYFLLQVCVALDAMNKPDFVRILLFLDEGTAPGMNINIGYGFLQI